MLETIGINVLSNIIFDVLKRIYIQVYSEENITLKKMESYVKDHIDFEFNSELDAEQVERFFKQPQIVDIIRSYVIYIVNGSFSEKLNGLKKNETVVLSSPFINESVVLDYLTDRFMEYCSPALDQIGRAEVRGYFSHIFSLANDFFLSQLDQKAKVEIYETNRMLAYGFSFISNKLDKYWAVIDATLRFPLVAQNTDYDQLRSDYMDILRNRYSKALIYLLDDFELKRFYIPPTLSVKSHTRAVVIRRETKGIQVGYLSSERWMNIFSQENIVYVTGGAGYGKSLLMRNIIINSDQLNIADSADHIVIFGEIKWCINQDGSFKSLQEFLKACIINSTMKDVGDDFINYHLKMGRCVLLLDALDEVPMERRKDLHHTIIAHLKNLNPNNKVCITSRDRGFIPVADEIEQYNIQPLDARQIEQYVDKIIELGKFDKHDKEAFMHQAKGLVEKKFLSSFLILSLLINIYKGEKELPETKLELYQKCLEYIANKREKPKTNNYFNWALITPLMKDNTFIELAQLCFPNNKEVKEREINEKLADVYRDTFVDTATLENAISEFLKFCSERTELFVPASVENSFKFFHRSFFEYFYSKYIVLRCENSEEIYKKLTMFDVDSEVFELTLARLKQETQDKYISLIKYTFDQCTLDFKKEAPSFKPINILILFFQVIDEMTFQNRFICLLTDYSELILKKIDQVSNSEILQAIFARANDFETAIGAYRQAAYTEVLQSIKGIDVQELRQYQEQEDQGEPDERFMRTLIPHFHFRQRRHFYTEALMSKYDMFTILAQIVERSQGLNHRHVSTAKKLLAYYDSLDDKHRQEFERSFR